MHDIETKAKACSLLSCGCTRYRTEASLVNADPYVSLGGNGRVLDSAFGSNRAQALMRLTGTTEEENHAAACTLAFYARDAAELRMFLQMCGLLPADAKPRHHRIPRAAALQYQRP